MAPVAGLAPARTRLKDEALGSLHSRAKAEVLPPGLAPGLRPHLGLNGYKPFVLLYTTGGNWRNAEGMLPNPQESGSISLAKNPGSLVRFTFQKCPPRRRRGIAVAGGRARRQESHLH